MPFTPSFDVSIIYELPPETLKLLPAGIPPDGVVANFTNPPSLVPRIIGVGTAFLALACACFLMRIYTNLVVTKKWNWSDLTCTLGFLCAIVYYAFVVLGCIQGPTGRHLWDVHVDRALSRGLLLQSYVTAVASTPAMGLIKCSLFIQYYTLFKVLRYVRISVYIGATFSTLFYITITVVVFALTSPWKGETLLEAVMSWHFAKFQDFSIPIGVIGMTVDWCLFMLPIPAVYGLHLSVAKKIGVMLIFMTGGLAAVASSVVLYYRIKFHNHPEDPHWDVGIIYIWTMIEMFAGITAASMPAVKRFFSHYHLLPSIRTSSEKSNPVHFLISSIWRSKPSKAPGASLPYNNLDSSVTVKKSTTSGSRTPSQESKYAPMIASDSYLELPRTALAPVEWTQCIDNRRL